MKLRFKQRFFLWFDSYDIYDSNGKTVYTVKGELSWGHLLRIYDANGSELGYIKQEILTILPRFRIYKGEKSIGNIYRELSLFTPQYTIDYKGWDVRGNWLEWDYCVYDRSGRTVASVSKEIFNWTDTYVIDVYNPDDALYVVMLVLAIDAEKCSRNN